MHRTKSENELLRNIKNNEKIYAGTNMGKPCTHYTLFLQNTTENSKNTLAADNPAKGSKKLNTFYGNSLRSGAFYFTNNFLLFYIIFLYSICFLSVFKKKIRILESFNYKLCPN